MNTVLNYRQEKAIRAYNRAVAILDFLSLRRAKVIAFFKRSK
jgi:hypothetical protein